MEKVVKDSMTPFFSRSRYARYLRTMSEKAQQILQSYEGSQLLIWGLNAGPHNRKICLDTTPKEDIVLFRDGSRITHIGNIDDKVIDATIIQSLRPGDDGGPRELTFLITGFHEVYIPIESSMGGECNLEMQNKMLIGPGSFSKRFNILSEMLARLMLCQIHHRIVKKVYSILISMNQDNSSQIHRIEPWRLGLLSVPIL